MEDNILTISDLRKIMIKNEYDNMYGTPTKEYTFKGINAWIEKVGNKIAHDKNKPYTVRYKRLGKNFKTLQECLVYISCSQYIHDSNILEDSLKNHYNYNPNN